MGAKIKKYTGNDVDRNVPRVSDRLGNLIDNGVVERVYKNTIKDPKPLKI